MWNYFPPLTLILTLSLIITLTLTTMVDSLSRVLTVLRKLIP